MAATRPVDATCDTIEPVLGVPDVHAGFAFYRDQLGFELVHTADDRTACRYAVKPWHPL